MKKNKQQIFSLNGKSVTRLQTSSMNNNNKNNNNKLIDDKDYNYDIDNNSYSDSEENSDSGSDSETESESDSEEIVHYDNDGQSLYVKKVSKTQSKPPQSKPPHLKPPQSKSEPKQQISEQIKTLLPSLPKNPIPKHPIFNLNCDLVDSPHERLWLIESKKREKRLFRESLEESHKKKINK
ncbi:hypothetical protein ACTFIY_011584 [Dictyostelium cf. discoideum]